MKVLCTILLVTLALATVSVSGLAQYVNSELWDTYICNTGKFLVRIPRNWQQIESNDPRLGVMKSILYEATIGGLDEGEKRHISGYDLIAFRETTESPVLYIFYVIFDKEQEMDSKRLLSIARTSALSSAQNLKEFDVKIQELHFDPNGKLTWRFDCDTRQGWWLSQEICMWFHKKGIIFVDFLGAKKDIERNLPLFKKIINSLLLQDDEIIQPSVSDKDKTPHFLAPLVVALVAATVVYFPTYYILLFFNNLMMGVFNKQQSEEQYKRRKKMLKIIAVPLVFLLFIIIGSWGLVG